MYCPRYWGRGSSAGRERGPTFGVSIASPNKGLIVGDVQLNPGDDVYDGRGGRIVGDVAGYLGAEGTLAKRSTARTTTTCSTAAAATTG